MNDSPSLTERRAQEGWGVVDIISHSKHCIQSMKTEAGLNCDKIKIRNAMATAEIFENKDCEDVNKLVWGVEACVS